MKQKKSLIELLIDLDRVNRQLEEINRPEYIEKRTREIFGDKKHYDPDKLIEQITASLF